MITLQVQMQCTVCVSICGVDVLSNKKKLCWLLIGDIMLMMRTTLDLQLSCSVEHEDFHDLPLTTLELNYSSMFYILNFVHVLAFLDASHCSILPICSPALSSALSLVTMHERWIARWGMHFTWRDVNCGCSCHAGPLLCYWHACSLPVAASPAELMLMHAVSLVDVEGMVFPCHESVIGIH